MKNSKAIKIFVNMLLLLSTVLLCACSEEIPYKNAKNYNRFQKQTVELTPSAKDVHDMELLCANESQMIYMEWLLIEKEGTYDYNTRFYLYDYNTGKSRPIELEGLIQGATLYYACFYDENALVVSDRTRHTIYLYDENLHLIEKKELQDIKFPDGNNYLEESNIESLYCDDHYIYFTSYGSLYILDMELNGVYADERTGGGFTILPNKYKNTIFEFWGKFYTFDPNKKAIIPQKGYERLKDWDFGRIYEGDATYDCYFFDDNNTLSDTVWDNGLFGLKDGKIYQIFGFDEMDISTIRVCYGCGISDGEKGYRLICLSSDGKRLQIIHLTPSKKAMNYAADNGKKQVDFGCMYLSGQMQNVINDFNADSTEYKINIVNYLSKYDNYDEALLHFNMDILDGNKLDMICLYGLDPDTLMEKGLLQDLNEYFLSSKVVTKDDFTEAFLEIVTDETGKIYYLYPSYMITGFVSEDTIDFSDLTEKINLLKEDKLYFGECNSRMLLSNILRYSGKRYVDVENGEVHFKEKDFQSLLQLIKAQKSVSVEDVEANTMFCKGEAHAIQAEILNPYWYFYYEKIFGKNFHVTTPGYDGAVLWEQYNTLGVISSSKDKEGAYALFEYLFSPNVYSANFSYDGFPVLKTCWDNWETKILATEKYIDAYGQYHIPQNRTLGYAEGQCIIEVGSISESAVKQMREVTENAVYIEPLSYEYINIITEEADAYFMDQKSLEDTCDIIEQRMKMALAEQ